MELAMSPETPPAAGWVAAETAAPAGWGATKCGAAAAPLVGGGDVKSSVRRARPLAIAAGEATTYLIGKQHTFE